MTLISFRLHELARVTAVVLTCACIALTAPHAFGASRRARESNTVPIISGTPAASVAAGTAYAFRPDAYDADGDPLWFRIRGKPSWAQFDGATGALTGTPRTSDIGTYSNITITVNDGKVTVAMPSFSITVTAPLSLAANSPPVISGTPATRVTAGQSYTFQPSATDADGDALTFAIQNKPSWASFSSSTGRLYGTPSSTAVGTYSSIVISVSDGSASSSLAPFSISVVAPPNTAPTISGTPPDTVVAGQTYAFTPTAADADGDTLTFAIQNKPAWATFDTHTGLLTGQPAAADVGNYTNILISVSDGTTSAQLAAFAVTVMQDVAGTVSLTWRAPTTNIDGSPITNLAGYKVFYGQVSHQYTQSLSLMSPDLTSVMIENLAAANWYFAVKAVSSSGDESDYSSEVSKLVQ